MKIITQILVAALIMTSASVTANAQSTSFFEECRAAAVDPECHTRNKNKLFGTAAAGIIGLAILSTMVDGGEAESTESIDIEKNRKEREESFRKQQEAIDNTALILKFLE